MSEISHETIEHLARLVRLRPSDQQSQRYAEQLNSVVEYIAKLQDVAIDPRDSEAAATGVSGLYNVLAADVPREIGDAAIVNPADFFAGAPASSNNYIQVRAVLSGGEESA